jgi:regulator of protease activity HflC (stomatin/prohibitin superfamily)
MKLLRIEQVGVVEADPSQDGDQDADGPFLKNRLGLARAKALEAEAARLEAETRLLDDVGSYYKGLAARAEAEADIMIAEKDRKELEYSNPRVQALHLAETAWQSLRNIRRSQDDIKRTRRSPTSNPKQEPRRHSGPGRGGGRVAQVPKTESVAQPKQ